MRFAAQSMTNRLGSGCVSKPVLLRSGEDEDRVVEAHGDTA